MRPAADKKALDAFTVGHSKSITRLIEERDALAFAELSGDHNPLHVDDEYASTTPFGKRVVHGLFLGSLTSQLIGMHLPGENALIMRISFDFKHPVFVGEEVTVRGTVTNISTAASLIELSLAVLRGGETVAHGSAHVRVRP